MKLRNLAIAALVALTAATGASAESKPYEIAGIKIGNPVDPSTWWDAGAFNCNVETSDVTYNFADPTFWMGFIDPARHTCQHVAVRNPRNWAHFLEVGTYTAMFVPSTWMKWVDVNSYAPLMDPQTYTYWMQPGAFQHELEMEHYTAFFQPTNYIPIAQAAVALVSDTVSLGGSVVSGAADALPAVPTISGSSSDY